MSFKLSSFRLLSIYMYIHLLKLSIFKKLKVYFSNSITLFTTQSFLFMFSNVILSMELFEKLTYYYNYFSSTQIRPPSCCCVMFATFKILKELRLIICVWLWCLTYPLLFLFSQIYCYGPLLHTVQMARLYKDSKTFVDMKLKNRPEETMEDYNAFMAKRNNSPTEAEIRDFVDVSLKLERLVWPNQHYILYFPYFHLDTFRGAR